jgi:TonB family protein
MKRLIFTSIIAVGLTLTASAEQSTPASPDTSAQLPTTKAKVTAPKAIDMPDPEPAFDPGKSPTVIWVVVGSDGRVHDAKVIKSSDSTKADANALTAVKKWRFKPATKDGVPVAVQINVEVDARHH